MRNGPITIIAILWTWVGLGITTWAQPCATGFLLSTSPLPQNGTYSCGQTVTFCLTITGWNSTSANWFHGVSATFGAGWDLSTLVPGPPPPTCGVSTGTWGWYNAVQGTSGSNIGVQGPGFFFDLNNDGNPGNNFGDFCVGATDWEFCWTISVLNPPACANGLDLGVSFNTFGDSETGSWGSSACGNDPIVPSTPAVVLACPANAGTNGTLTSCSNAAAVNLITLLGGTPNVGGQWTDPTGNPHGNTFDPATDPAGSYTYTVTSVVPPCTAQATVQIAVNPAPNAGTNATVSLCSSSPPSALITALAGADPGGTWTGPTGLAFNGVFDPATGIPGVHTYTVTGLAPCTNASATVTVDLAAAPDAGTAGNITLCNTGVVADLFNALGGTPDLGGAWTAPDGTPSSGSIDPATADPGSYTYTIAAAAPCPAATTTVDVVVVPQPSAGLDNTAAFCRTAGVQALLPLLGGAPTPGGTWTSPSGATFGANLNTASAAAGTYTYTVSPPAPCLAEQATLTITLIDQPDAGTDGTLLLCAAGAAADLSTGLSASADGGGSWTAPDGSVTDTSFDPAVEPAGIYTYTIPATAPCIASSANVEVTIAAQPDAGTDATTDVCSDGGLFQLLPLLGPTAQPGGVWTAPNGTNSTGSIDPASAASGIYTYTLSAPAPCVSASAMVNVNIVQAPDAGTSQSLTACTAGPAIDLFAALGGTPDVGGAWTDGSGAPINALLPAATATSGEYTYTVNGSAPCVAANAVVSLTVVDIPDSGADAVFAVCNNGGPPLSLLELLGGTPDGGGSWSAPDGSPHGPQIDPAIDEAGLYTYSLSAPAPCPTTSSTVNVSIVQPPPTATQSSAAFCSVDDAAPLLPLLDATLPGTGQWTLGGAAVAGNMFDPSNMTGGTYTYTLVGTAPCPNGIHQLSITVTPAANAGTDGAVSVCSDGAPVDLFTALGTGVDVGGLWFAPSGSSTAATQLPATASAGFYTYMVPANGPCPSDTSTVDLAIVTASNSGIGGNVALCRSDDSLDPMTWLSGLPDLGGSWTGPDGTTIDVVVPASMAPGAYTYTVAGTAPCPSVSSQVIVAVQALPFAGDEMELTGCVGAPAISLDGVLPSGADANGVWTDAGGVPVTELSTAMLGSSAYNYVVQGIGACANEVDSALLEWQVHPIPEVSFSATNARGCAPLDVQFTAQVDGSIVGYDWDFGNGGGSDLGPTTSYTYVQSGLYSVTLTVTDTNGCSGSFFLPAAVITSTGPEAAFYTWPERVSVEDPSFTVQHEPTNGVAYTWTLGVDTVLNSGSFRWTVMDAVVGPYPICLIATDSLGCAATVCTTVELDDALTVYVPNAFTPDGDGLNELFLPSILGLDPESYELIIADRWGRTVFISTDPALAWTGAMDNSGELLPQGVYVWRLRVRDNYGAEGMEYFGTVTLLK